MFLGNSASYFYFAVSQERDSYLIPISGRYLIDEYTIPHQEKRRRFEEVYLSPIVTKALNEGRRIVLVDHSHTGRSVDSFNSLLQISCPKCPRSFLNLVTEAQNNRWIQNPKTVTTLGQVVVPNVAVDLFNDGYVRLTPHHPHWEWHESSSSLLEKYQENPLVSEAIRCIRNIQNPSSPSVQEATVGTHGAKDGDSEENAGFEEDLNETVAAPALNDQEQEQDKATRDKIVIAAAVVTLCLVAAAIFFFMRE